MNVVTCFLMIWTLTLIQLLLLICPLEIEAKYERKMRSLREELELRRKTEIHEIEERKNSQINTLMRNHEKAFSDIKNYYNDITLNNLALINSLKVKLASFWNWKNYRWHWNSWIYHTPMFFLQFSLFVVSLPAYLL